MTAESSCSCWSTNRTATRAKSRTVSVTVKVDEGEGVEALVLEVAVVSVVEAVLSVGEDNGKEVELVSGITTGVEES